MKKNYTELVQSYDRKHDHEKMSVQMLKQNYTELVQIWDRK